MRAIVLSIGIIATMLAGCTTAQIESSIQSVQSISDGLCSFVPTVETVITELNAAVGATTTAVAQSICAAVATVSVTPTPPAAAARLRATPLKTRVGTPVHGYFTAGPNAGKSI